MLNVYDVIAIGVVSLSTITIVKLILDFLHTNSVNRTFRKALDKGIIRPADTDSIKNELMRRAADRYRKQKEEQRSDD